VFKLTCPSCAKMVRVRLACRGSKARCPKCQQSYRLNDQTMVNEHREELLAQQDRPTPNDNSKSYSSLWTAFTRDGLGEEQPAQLPSLPDDPSQKKKSLLKRMFSN
jgi:hypothetical protein